MAYCCGGPHLPTEVLTIQANEVTLNRINLLSTHESRKALYSENPLKVSQPSASTSLLRHVELCCQLPLLSGDDKPIASGVYVEGPSCIRIMVLFDATFARRKQSVVINS